MSALADCGAIAHLIGRDWRMRDGRLTTVGGSTVHIPRPPGLLESNVGAALQAIESSGASELNPGLMGAVSAVTLPGRLTTVEIDGIQLILDVAHNTESVSRLADFLRRHPCERGTHALFGVMGDKPVRDMIHACAGIFDDWRVVDLSHIPRAMSVERLVSEIGAEQVKASGPFSEVWVDVLQRCQPGDRAVVFGSFYTVSEALGLLAQQRDV